MILRYIKILEPTSKKWRLFLDVYGTKHQLSISSDFLENIKVKGPQLLDYKLCNG